MKKYKVYMLIEDLFEDSEAIYPYYRMQEEDFEVILVGPAANKDYKGKKGNILTSDISVEDADPNEADALIIPGGYAPDRMRRNKEMVDLVKKMHGSCKVIAAICHGPWMMAEADLL